MTKKKGLALHWKIIIGLLLGILWAVFASFAGLSQFTINWIDPFGEIFIRILKLIAVPLILFSIIDGIAGMGSPSSLGKMGFKTLVSYLGTTILAVGVGLMVVNVIQPGKALDDDALINNRIQYELWANNNGVEIKDGKCLSCDEQYKALTAEIADHMQMSPTEESIVQQIESVNKSQDTGPLQALVDMAPENLFVSLSNNTLMLQVIVFAIFFGICLILIPTDKAKPVIDVVHSINEVFLKMVDVVMQAAPFFVFALLAGTVSKIAGDNPSQVVEIFKGLGTYSLTVVVGLAIVLFLVYPNIVKYTTGIPYRDFFKAMSPAQTLAFSTSSSAATLPVTIECVEQNLKVDNKVSSFVLPIGATVNMDGTSLYQAVAVVFLAQFHLIDLSLGQQLTIVLTATLASIGSAAVPSAGLVMLIIVLESVGLNPAWIAIIFPVDRILDMTRTIINITGDATVATVIAKTEDMLYYGQEDS